MSRLSGEVRACLAFFTRLPVGGGDLKASAGLRLAPLAGMLIGAFGGALYALLSPWLPVGVTVGIVLLATVALTGALHEDGLMDVCDGFGLPRNTADTLRIMRDPYVGAFGVLGAIFVVGLRWSAVVALTGALAGPLAIGAALVAGHGLSRAFAVTPLATADYVGADGRSAAVVHRMSSRDLGIVWLLGMLGCLPALALAGPAPLLGLGLAVLAYAVANHIFRSRLGGYTGDCLGTIQQLTELAFYLGVLSWLGLSP